MQQQVNNKLPITNSVVTNTLPVATGTKTKEVKLLILRGSTGSGKTTLATETKAFKTWKITSADKFFINSDGKYVFDRKKLQDAHNVCFTETYNYLAKGFNVIVDNTNRDPSEFSRYLKLANNEFLPKVVIKVYSMHFYYGSTKLIPPHVINRFFKEYVPFPGEKYVSLNRETGIIQIHDDKIVTIGVTAK
jgi:tRNA uridine 5-carbamoylmethylation protein Kti12